MGLIDGGEFNGPLLPDGGRANDDEPAFLFGPELAEDDSGFDGLAEADFIGEDDSFGEGRLEGKEGGFDLVGVEIDLGVEKGLREPAKAFCIVK